MDPLNRFLKVSSRIFFHKKTFSVAKLCGMTPIEAAARIIKIWAWAESESPSGDVTALFTDGLEIGMTAAWIELSKPRTINFLNHAIDKEFFDRVGDKIFIHDWADGTGGYLQKREAELASDRERKSRKKDGIPKELPNDSGGNPAEFQRNPSRDTEKLHNTASSELISSQRPTDARHLGDDAPAPEPEVKLSKKRKPDPTPYQEILDAYHEICTSLPIIKKFTPTLKTHMRCRWDENADLEAWRDVFRKAQASDFIKRKKFCLRWFCKSPDNWLKTAQNNYENEELPLVKPKPFNPLAAFAAKLTANWSAFCGLAQFDLTTKRAELVSLLGENGADAAIWFARKNGVNLCQNETNPHFLAKAITGVMAEYEDLANG